MSLRFVEWLLFTCLIGLIPVLARALVWALSNGEVEPMMAADWAAYGIVLHCVNIHEGSRVGADDPRWKAVHNATSVLFLITYALLLTLAILEDQRINPFALLDTTVTLSIISTLLSGAIFFRRQEVER